MKKFVKKLLSVLLILVILLGNVAFLGKGSVQWFNSLSLNAYASDGEEEEIGGECGPNVKWMYDDFTNTLLIYGSGAMYNYSTSADVLLPDWCYGHIGYTDITINKVVIGDGVTSIGSFAFYKLNNLHSVSIPSSVRTIGGYAFYMCENLHSIYIPNSVVTIGANAFAECYNLSTIIIGNGVVNIGNCAFHNAPATYLTIGKNVRNVGEDVFVFQPGDAPKKVTFTGTASDWCKISFPDSDYVGTPQPNLYAEQFVISGEKNGAFILSDSLKEIPGNAFTNCNNITSVTIPDSVTKIGYSAFENCTNLINVSIPDSVTDINPWAFGFCTNLKNISIPDSVTRIGHCAFYNCTGLKNISIPCGVTTLETNTFCDCTQLKKVTIPDSVTTFERNIFTGCSSLTDIYYTGTNVQWNNIDKGSNNELKKVKIHCNVAATHAHTWEAWECIVYPTFDTYGEEIRRCSICNAAETRKIEKLKRISSVDTGVQLDYSDELEEGTTLYVTKVTDENCLRFVFNKYGTSKTDIFDITPKKGGVNIQPTGKVKIRIPVPAEYNSEMIVVAYINPSSNEATIIPCEIVDGYVEFETDHFSQYAILEAKGFVESVSVDDISINFKSYATINATINAESNVKYTVKYSSSNPNIVTVDENSGKIYGVGKGSATITCTVVDEYGKTIQDTCNVTVSYSFWQWIIKIVLLGFIWYN